MNITLHIHRENLGTNDELNELYRAAVQTKIAERYPGVTVVVAIVDGEGYDDVRIDDLPRPVEVGHTVTDISMGAWHEVVLPRM